MNYSLNGTMSLFHRCLRRSTMTAGCAALSNTGSRPTSVMRSPAPHFWPGSWALDVESVCAKWQRSRLARPKASWNTSLIGDFLSTISAPQMTLWSKLWMRQTCPVSIGTRQTSYTPPVMEKSSQFAAKASLPAIR